MRLESVGMRKESSPHRQHLLRLPCSSLVMSSSLLRTPAFRAAIKRSYATSTPTQKASDVASKAADTAAATADKGKNAALSALDKAKAMAGPTGDKLVKTSEGSFFVLVHRPRVSVRICESCRLLITYQLVLFASSLDFRKHSSLLLLASSLSHSRFTSLLSPRSPTNHPWPPIKAF